MHALNETPATVKRGRGGGVRDQMTDATLKRGRGGEDMVNTRPLTPNNDLGDGGTGLAIATWKLPVVPYTVGSVLLCC